MRRVSPEWWKNTVAKRLKEKTCQFSSIIKCQFDKVSGSRLAIHSNKVFATGVAGIGGERCMCVMCHREVSNPIIDVGNKITANQWRGGGINQRWTKTSIRSQNGKISGTTKCQEKSRYTAEHIFWNK